MRATYVCENSRAMDIRMLSTLNVMESCDNKDTNIQPMFRSHKRVSSYLSD